MILCCLYLLTHGLPVCLQHWASTKPIQNNIRVRCRGQDGMSHTFHPETKVYFLWENKSESKSQLSFPQRNHVLLHKLIQLVLASKSNQIMPPSQMLTTQVLQVFTQI